MIGASKSKRFVFVSPGREYMSCFQTAAQRACSLQHDPIFKAYENNLLNYQKEHSSEILLIMRVKDLRNVFSAAMKSQQIVITPQRPRAP